MPPSPTNKPDPGIIITIHSLCSVQNNNLILDGDDKYHVMVLLIVLTIITSVGFTVCIIFCVYFLTCHKSKVLELIFHLLIF